MDDLFVNCIKNGSLIVNVHRKPTHTDKYLDYNSHHNKQHKVSKAVIVYAILSYYSLATGHLHTVPRRLRKWLLESRISLTVSPLQNHTACHVLYGLYFI